MYLPQPNIKSSSYETKPRKILIVNYCFWAGFNRDLHSSGSVLLPPLRDNPLGRELITPNRDASIVLPILSPPYTFLAWREPA